MEEYIDIKEKSGNIKKCQVILRYHDETSDKYYIIYEKDNTYYAAKYEDKIGETTMDTNLTKEETAMLEQLLNNIQGE